MPKPLRKSRTLRGDLGRLTQIARQVCEHEPLLAVGLAAGVGFAAGGGPLRRVLVAASGAGLRAALNFASYEWETRTRSVRAQSKEGEVECTTTMNPV